jgi:hypothetical protein
LVLVLGLVVAVVRIPQATVMRMMRKTLVEHRVVDHRQGQAVIRLMTTLLAMVLVGRQRMTTVVLAVTMILTNLYRNHHRNKSLR